ncbi:unnamed protein product [Sphagnum troendelagicum]|uniref:xyloglucan:xyloglucosyl transferase n=1 Tax=Sphagnum troendelagicum TaxID=128251 RepID=A0ABP0TNR6_9BRYO
MQLSSNGATHDELDFEFLGNITGQPYILQTNVPMVLVTESNGSTFGSTQLQISNTTLSIGTKTMSCSWWTMCPFECSRTTRTWGCHISTARRWQCAQVCGTDLNGPPKAAESKIDWQYAPFIATYEGSNVDGCAVQNNNNLAGCAVASSNKWAQAPALTWHQTNQLKWIRHRYLVYNYCTDKMRYPTPPTECGTSIL